MRRSEIIKSLRPDLPQVSISPDMSEIEKFQNEVLRPVLKCQNEVFMRIFEYQLQKRKMIQYGKNIHHKVDFVTQFVHNDPGFRNVVIGVVLGLLTEDEVSQYHTHDNEYRRRISQMVIDRIVDQWSPS